MAEPSQDPFTFFGNNLVQLRFKDVGDELALHEHDFPHGSIVMHGDVVVFGTDKEITLKAGQRINFPANKPHGIRALTAGALVLNVLPSTKGYL